DVDALSLLRFVREHLHHAQRLITFLEFIIGESPRATTCIYEGFPSRVHVGSESDRLKSAIRVREFYGRLLITSDDVILIVGWQCGEIVIAEDRAHGEVWQ